jgi:hypothetical protein
VGRERACVLISILPPLPHPREPIAALTLRRLPSFSRFFLAPRVDEGSHHLFERDLVRRALHLRDGPVDDPLEMHHAQLDRVSGRRSRQPLSTLDLVDGDDLPLPAERAGNYLAECVDLTVDRDVAHPDPLEVQV